MPRPSLWAHIRRRGKPRDAALMAVLPVVLVGVFLLPVELTRSLALHYRNPTVLTAVANHFVHFSAGHLQANLFGYLVVVPFAYVLATLGEGRTAFVVLFVTIVAVYPAVLSGFNLLYRRPGVGFGASGLVLAFAGLVPAFFVEYARRHISPAVGRNWIPLLFVAGAAIVTLRVVVPTPVGPAATAAVAGALLLSAVPVVRSLGRARIDWRTLPPAETVFGALALAALGLVLVLAFPTDPVRDGTMVNLYTHLLGYGLSCVAAYVGLATGVLGDESSSPSETAR